MIIPRGDLIRGAVRDEEIVTSLPPPPLIRFGTHCCGIDCPSVTATRAWLRASGPVSQKVFIPFLFSTKIRIGESAGIKLGVSVAVAEVTWEIVVGEILVQVKPLTLELLNFCCSSSVSIGWGACRREGQGESLQPDKRDDTYTEKTSRVYLNRSSVICDDLYRDQELQPR